MYRQHLGTGLVLVFTLLGRRFARFGVTFHFYRVCLVCLLCETLWKLIRHEHHMMTDLTIRFCLLCIPGWFTTDAVVQAEGSEWGGGSRRRNGGYPPKGKSVRAEGVLQVAASHQFRFLECIGSVRRPVDMMVTSDQFRLLCRVASYLVACSSSMSIS